MKCKYYCTCTLFTLLILILCGGAVATYILMQKEIIILKLNLENKYKEEICKDLIDDATIPLNITYFDEYQKQREEITEIKTTSTDRVQSI